MKKLVHLSKIFLAAFCLTLCLAPIKAQAVTDTEKKVFRYLTDELDFSPAAACGIMANIKAESGFNSNIYGVGSAYGLCQWTGIRITRLRNYCSSNGLDYTSMEGQLRFVKYELKTWYSSVYKYITSVSNDATGAYNAAYHWCMYYEMPSNMAYHSANRGSIAKSTYWPSLGSATMYITSSAVTGGLKLSWSASSGGGFVIKRCRTQSGTYTTVGKVGKSARSYTDTSGVKGNKYYYCVYPLSKSGKEGTRSNIVAGMSLRSIADSQCSVRLSGNVCTYNGKARRPKVTVKYGSTVLKKDKDYTVTYSDNTNAGTATVKVKGKDRYIGKVSRTFTIRKATLECTAKDVNVHYQKGVSFTPEVSFGAFKNVKYKLVSDHTAVVKGNGKKLDIVGLGKARVHVRVGGSGNFNALDKAFIVTIRPPRTVVSSVSVSSGSIKVKWDEKVTPTGYEIRYTNAPKLTASSPIINVRGKKSVTIQKPGKGSWRIQVRGYKITPGGTKVIGKWSKVRVVTIK